jgi:hypothetical protein
MCLFFALLWGLHCEKKEKKRGRDNSSDLIKALDKNPRGEREKSETGE